MFQKLLKLDWILLFSIFLLIGISLLSLYSISTIDQTAGLNIFVKQSIFAGFGILILFVFAFADYRYFVSYSRYIYFFTLLTLFMVLIWGVTIRGTSGWIGIGQFSVQPVEFSKLALALFLASFISKKKTELSETTRLIVSLLLSGIIIFLVLKQPDFGSAVVLLAIWLGMILISGINKKAFAVIMLVGLVAVFSSWFFLKDYQKARIINFVKPQYDVKGSGYNVNQAIIAVGSGGILGKGIGHGSQSQLNFIPEKQTDFIFAVITEELGILGSYLILFLYAVIIFRISKIAVSARDNFGFLLASGIMVIIFMQVAINIGMNIGLIPVAGIPLPFLSYGGSSLVSLLASIGILSNIYLRRKAHEGQIVQSY